MLLYKIINDHAAILIRQSFRLYSEGDTLHDLRNHATDLVLQNHRLGTPKPPTWYSKTKWEFDRGSFKYNEAIHWNSLPNEAKNANSIY